MSAIQLLPYQTMHALLDLFDRFIADQHLLQLFAYGFFQLLLGTGTERMSIWIRLDLKSRGGVLCSFVELFSRRRPDFRCSEP